MHRPADFFANVPRSIWIPIYIILPSSVEKLIKSEILSLLTARPLSNKLKLMSEISEFIKMINIFFKFTGTNTAKALCKAFIIFVEIYY
jgi:hypothetical protein